MIFLLKNNSFTITKQYKMETEKQYDHINPDHYKQSGSLEVIEMMVAIWGKDSVATYCEITAFKYRLRACKKPDQPAARDLEKAYWYEAKAKELKQKSPVE